LRVPSGRVCLAGEVDHFVQGWIVLVLGSVGCIMVRVLNRLIGGSFG
jgi:hypothetical protein